MSLAFPDQSKDEAIKLDLFNWIFSSADVTQRILNQAFIDKAVELILTNAKDADDQENIMKWSIILLQREREAYRLLLRLSTTPTNR
jgi:hypothetical protein